MLVNGEHSAVVAGAQVIEVADGVALGGSNDDGSWWVTHRDKRLVERLIALRRLALTGSGREAVDGGVHPCRVGGETWWYGWLLERVSDG